MPGRFADAGAESRWRRFYPQSDTTGDIVTCSAATLRVWSINGDLLAVQSTSNFVDPITAVAFSLVSSAVVVQHAALKLTRHAVPRWCNSLKLLPLSQRVIELARLCCGVEISATKSTAASLAKDLVSRQGASVSSSNTHSRRLSFPSPTAPAWRLTLLATLHHRDRLSSQSSATSNTTITALSFTARSLYVGDLAGRVWLYNPPGTEMFLPDSTNGGLCMGCSSKFGFVECKSVVAALGHVCFAPEI